MKNVRESKVTSEKNKKLILDFSEFCVTDGLSFERVEHYLRILKKIGEIFCKSFEEATKADVVELVGKLNRGSFLCDFSR